MGSLRLLLYAGRRPQYLLRDAPRPDPLTAQRAIRQVLAGRACTLQIELAIPEAERTG